MFQSRASLPVLLPAPDPTDKAGPTHAPCGRDSAPWRSYGRSDIAPPAGSQRAIVRHTRHSLEAQGPMKRREFIGLLGAALTARPQYGAAQSAPIRRNVAMTEPSTVNNLGDAFDAHVKAEFVDKDVAATM